MPGYDNGNKKNSMPAAGGHTVFEGFVLHCRIHVRLLPQAASEKEGKMLLHYS